MVETQETAFQVAQELIFGLRQGEQSLQERIGKHKFFLRKNCHQVLLEIIREAKERKEIITTTEAIWQRLPGLEIKVIRELLGLTQEEFIKLLPEKARLELEVFQKIEKGRIENKNFNQIARDLWQERILGLLHRKRLALGLNPQDLINFLPFQLKISSKEYLLKERGEAVTEVELVVRLLDILSQMKPKKRWGDEERARFFLDKTLKKLLEIREKNKIVERDDRLSPKNMNVLNKLIENIEKLKQWFGKRRLAAWITSSRSGLHILHQGIKPFLLREYVRQAVDLFDYFQVIATQVGHLTFAYYDPLLLRVARAKADEELCRTKNF